MTRPVAVLRPEPGNARTAARVEAAGLAAIRLPLFAVAPLAWQPPDPARFDALLATSANAFRHGGAGLAGLRALPVLAVGAATAAAARAAGFAVAATGQHDARALVADAAAGRRLLHLAGRDRIAPDGIAPDGIAPAGVTAIAVYAADALPVAPDAVRALFGGVALLHSARAACRLGALADAAHGRDRIRLAALSPAVQAAAGEGWAGTEAAALPDDAALVALAVGMAAAIDRARRGEDNRDR